jgi:hypothetical protein
MLITHKHPEGWADNGEAGKIQPSSVVAMEHQAELDADDLTGAGGALLLDLTAEASARNTQITQAVAAEASARNTQVTQDVAAEASARNTQITQAVAAEASARNTQVSQVTQAVAAETETRQTQDTLLNGQIQATNEVLAGTQTLTLTGALLSRTVPGGTTVVLKSLFGAGTVFVEGKTLVYDARGTGGVVSGQDSTQITVATQSISPMGISQPAYTNAPLVDILVESASIAQANAFACDASSVWHFADHTAVFTVGSIGARASRIEGDGDSIKIYYERTLYSEVTQDGDVYQFAGPVLFRGLDGHSGDIGGITLTQNAIFWGPKEVAAELANASNYLQRQIDTLDAAAGNVVTTVQLGGPAYVLETVNGVVSIPEVSAETLVPDANDYGMFATVENLPSVPQGNPNCYAGVISGGSQDPEITLFTPFFDASATGIVQPEAASTEDEVIESAVFDSIAFPVGGFTTETVTTWCNATGYPGMEIPRLGVSRAETFTSEDTLALLGGQFRKHLMTRFSANGGSITLFDQLGQMPSGVQTVLLNDGNYSNPGFNEGDHVMFDSADGVLRFFDGNDAPLAVRVAFAWWETIYFSSFAESVSFLNYIGCQFLKDGKGAWTWQDQGEVYTPGGVVMGENRRGILYPERYRILLDKYTQAETDKKISDAITAGQLWLPAVDTVADLPNVPDMTKTYLCRVVNDNDVYQRVAGSASSWELYSSNTDYVDNTELAAALGELDTELRAQINSKAPIASPTFTGAPKAPTATPGTNTTQLATTAFVTAAVAVIDSSNTASLGDVTTDAEVEANAFTATTHTFPNLLTSFWRKINWLFANKSNLASPTFTGTPAAPTATSGTNTTQIATTAFVTAAASVTLADNGASTTLPTVASGTLVSKVQALRDNVKQLFAYFTSGAANLAVKLQTARTLQTNLASTTAVGFDGSAAITPGVTGTLPLANGGTGATTAAAARTNLELAARIIKATCETAAATVAKEVTLEGYTPTAGDLVFVTYTLGNTGASPTLNFNALGAKAIRLAGQLPTGEANTGAAYCLALGVVAYYFDGTYFNQLGNNDITDADTTSITSLYGAVDSQFKVHNPSVGGTTTAYYPLVGLCADGTIEKITATTNATTAGARTFTTTPISYCENILYGSLSTTAWTAGALFAGALFSRIAVSTTNWKYSIGNYYDLAGDLVTNAVTTDLLQAPLYVGGTPSAHGCFIPSEFSLTPRNTSLIYKRIGYFSTAGYYYHSEYQPVYRYTGGAWVGETGASLGDESLSNIHNDIADLQALIPLIYAGL